MDRVQSDIGLIIKQIRIENNLSQADLAKKTNLHRTFVGGVERGERNITLVTLSKLSDALSVPISEIFSKAGL